jgi:hypothetical protein
MNGLQAIGSVKILALLATRIQALQIFACTLSLTPQGLYAGSCLHGHLVK